jgi:predicted AlkP superfamily phosphohydrolase/phosphomutase
VSPLQIDPLAPAMPISTPGEWSRDLAETLGRFYTQELPEDTKAYTGGIFTAHEFWEQSQFVYREQRRALDAMLDEFERGLLFFYFSSVDQGSHMLYRYTDAEHPAFVADDLLQTGIRTLYEEMDEAVGRVLEAVDDRTTLIVMSDHGFSSFHWGVNLNSWLLENGYVTLIDPERRDGVTLFSNVDWNQTTAYAAGLNGLYVNLEGREEYGIVEPGDYEAVLDRLERDLVAMRDPRNGRQPVTLVYRAASELRGPFADLAPDIIVGYNRGYRSAWESPLGEFPREVFVDNDDPWSGDHSIDYRLVPGVLVTNQRITMERPALYDLTVAVLDEFGVAPLPDMIGRDCLAPRD